MAKRKAYTYLRGSDIEELKEITGYTWAELAKTLGFKNERMLFRMVKEEVPITKTVAKLVCFIRKYGDISFSLDTNKRMLSYD
jgi:hypothetical protein